MVFSKKICLYTTFLGLIFSFNLQAEDAPLEKVASAVKNDTYVNLVTRVAAKTGFDYTSEAIKNDAANQVIFAPGDVAKAIANAALDELAPLPKDAHVVVKHVDLLVPVVLSKILQKMSLEAADKELAISLLKKELGKGLFINSDFKNLETLEDAAFFTADFAAEAILKDKDLEKDPVNGLKRACASKIITPVIMAYAGNALALAPFKTDNKNVQKAITGLFEKLVVSKMVSAALAVQK